MTFSKCILFSLQHVYCFVQVRTGSCIAGLFYWRLFLFFLRSVLGSVRRESYVKTKLNRAKQNKRERGNVGCAVLQENKLAKTLFYQYIQYQLHMTQFSAVIYSFSPHLIPGHPPWFDYMLWLYTEFKLHEWQMIDSDWSKIIDLRSIARLLMYFFCCTVKQWFQWAIWYK